MGSQLQTSEEMKLVIGLLVASAMLGSYSIVEAKAKPMIFKEDDDVSDGEGAGAKEDEKECAKEGKDCFFPMKKDSEGNPRCCFGFGCDEKTLKCKECAGDGEDCTMKKCCRAGADWTIGTFLICQHESMESKKKTCGFVGWAK